MNIFHLRRVASWLDDYRDFLRIRKIDEWPKEHKYAKRLSQLIRTPNANYDTSRRGIEHPDLKICGNVIIWLIKVTTFLLNRQIRTLEKQFVEQGGLSERVMQARLQTRNRQRK